MPSAAAQHGRPEAAPRRTGRAATSTSHPPGWRVAHIAQIRACAPDAPLHTSWLWGRLGLNSTHPSAAGPASPRDSPKVVGCSRHLIGSVVCRCGHRPEFGRHRPNSGRLQANGRSPTSPELGPSVVKFGRILASLGRSRPKFGRHQPQVGGFHAKVGRVRPNVAPTPADFGLMSAKLGPDATTSRPCRPAFHRFRQSLACMVGEIARPSLRNGKRPK